MNRLTGWWVGVGILLLGLGSAQAQTVWWESGMVKLRQANSGSAGDPLPTDADICTASGCGKGGVTLSAARNEFEPFQVLIAAPAASGLTGVDLKIGDLKDSAGNLIIAQDAAGKPKNIVMYREHYLSITSTTLSSAEGKAGMWPDGLVPKVDEYFGEVRKMPTESAAAFPFNVAADQKQGIWFDVYVPTGTPAGLYTGSIQVTIGGTVAAQIPVKLTVRDFELPSTPTLKTAYAVGIGEAAMGHYGTKSITDAQYWELICLYTKEMLLHRVSNENLVWPKLVGDSTGKINWSLPAISTTCNQRYPEFLTGGNPNLLPNGKLPGAKVTRARMRDGTGLSSTAVQSAAYYKDYIQHFADMGWKDRLFYYLWDEPPYPLVNGVRRCDLNYNGTASTAWTGAYNKSKFFKDNGLDLPIMMTTDRQTSEDCFTNYLKVPDYTRYLDIWTVPNKHMQGRANSDFPFNANLRGTYDSIITPGKELWWYQACGNHGCSGSETDFVAPMADLPAIYSRAFEWLTYKYQIGYGVPGPATELYFETVYAYQFSTNDPWKNIYYFSGNGDGTYFYPGRPDKIGGTTHIPISSIRMKMLREGIEDYEYLVQVEAKKNQEGLDGKSWIKENILDPYLTAKDPNDGVNKFITYVWNKNPGGATSAAGLLRARQEMAQILSAKPDFTMTASPSAATLLAGAQTTATVSISSQNGFNSAVDLSCSTPNATVSCAVAFPTVGILANGSVSPLLTVTTQGTTPAGNYSIVVNGVSGDLQRQTTFMVTVQPPPDFKLSASPASASVVAGSAVSSSITLTSLNGFNTATALTCASSNPAVACSLVPASVAPPAGGTASSTLNVATQGATPAGSYSVTVSGASGGLLRQTLFALTVQSPPDFKLTASPASVTVTAGNAGTASISLASLNGFNAATGLTCAASNPGVTCALSPASVTPPAGGTVSSTLTLTTQASTPAGSYSVTVSGTSGILLRQATVALIVQAAPLSFTDSFDRANSTLLGNNWNEYLVDFEIYGNQVRNKDTAGQEAQFTRSIGPDQSASVSCKTTAAGNSCGVIARWSNANNFYYALIDPGLGSVALFKRVNGVFTRLAVAGRTMSFNTFYQIRLVTQGSAIRVYFNGESAAAISLTDASLTSGNYAGIRSYAAAVSTTYFDNFKVTLP